MATCEICGTEFDERGVQIVLPGLAKSFDRIDCAARARTLAGPPGLGVEPLRAVFVDIAPRSEARSFGLHGLPAGLAAALAGGRARLALGGASVAVALLVATTVHLSSRTGGGSDLSARASVLPSSPRYAGDFLFRGTAADARSTKSAPVVEARAPAVSAPAPQEADGIFLVSHRPQPGARSTSRAAADAPRRAQKRKAARYSRHTSGRTPTRTGGSVSTRPGWGWGDKNHAHGGPGKGSSRRHK